MTVLQGMVIEFQLHGQAVDQCASITKEQLKSVQGVNMIVNAIFRRDFASVIWKLMMASELCWTFVTDSMSLRRILKCILLPPLQSFILFLQPAKYCSVLRHWSFWIMHLSSILNAFLCCLLQPSLLWGFSDQASNDDSLKVVTYCQVSSIVDQCEKSDKPSVATMFGNNSGRWETVTTRTMMVAIENPLREPKELFLPSVWQAWTLKVKSSWWWKPPW